MKGISIPIWKKPKMTFSVDGWDYEDFWRLMNDLWNNEFGGSVIGEALYYLCNIEHIVKTKLVTLLGFLGRKHGDKM